MSDKNTIDEYLQLKQIEGLKELLKKEEPKKTSWWEPNVWKLYILLILAYPFVGALYAKLLWMILPKPF